MARVLIVGGSDAGISAALRARELDSAVEVTVLLADAYPNFSICGLPYYLSGDVPDWRSLAHRSVEELEHAGIELLLEHRVEEVDATTQTVVTRGGRHRYDRLVVATGAEPVRPPIPGLEHEGVHQLHTIGDARLLDEVLARGPERAVIVGAGYIGLEMAEALRARGLDVTLVEQLPAVLPTVDRELGELVREELQRNGVLVLTDSTVSAIEEHGARLIVLGEHLRKEADVVLVVVGVRPSVEQQAFPLAPTVRCRSTGAWRPRSPTSSQQATAPSPITGSSRPTHTSRSVRPHTSRAGSPGRTRSVAIAATTALSAPRSSRSSSSRSPGPGSATRRRQRPD